MKFQSQVAANTNSRGERSQLINELCISRMHMMQLFPSVGRFREMHAAMREMRSGQGLARVN